MHYQGGEHWRWLSYAGMFIMLFIFLSPFIGLLSSIGSIEFSSLQNLVELATLLGRSVLLAVSAALLAGLLGGVLAFSVVHYQKKYRALTSLIFISPIFIPSYIHALSWSRMLDSVIVVNPWLTTLWVVAISYFPIVFVVTYYYCQRWSQQSHDAVLMHSDTKSAFWLEVAYLKRPFFIACLVVFFFGFSDFGVADLFQIRVYSTEVFIQITAFYDVPKAILLSLPVIIIGLALFGLIYKLTENLPSFRLDNSVQTVFYQEYSKFVAGISLTLGILIVLLPVFNLLVLSGSVENLVKAVNLSLNDLLSSAIVAISVAAISVIITLLLSYLYSRGIFEGIKVIRFVLFVLFLFPAALIALGLIQFWNHPGWVGWFYQSGLIMVLGLSLLWMAIAFELFYAGWRSLDESQEQAVFLAGGNRWSALKGVLLPQKKILIAFIFMLCFIFSYNEITMLVLLSPPGYSSMPLRIFSTVHYGTDYLLAALCVVQLVILYLFMGMLFLLGKKLLTNQQEVNTC